MTQAVVPSVRPQDAPVAEGAKMAFIARPREFYPLAVLIPMSIVLCARMWGRVGEVAIDFGREVYVPWQIAQGCVLYRDLAYIFGPLSPYVNAVWWMIFGGGDRSVVIGNVLVLIVTCVLLWRIMLIASDRYAATLAMMVFLAYGAFGVTVHTTNYNFLTPYAHSMTHGLALCAGIVLGLGGLARSRKATRTPLASAFWWDWPR